MLQIHELQSPVAGPAGSHHKAGRKAHYQLLPQGSFDPPKQKYSTEISAYCKTRLTFAVPTRTRSALEITQACIGELRL